MNDCNHWIETLQAHGYRLTRQRRLIIKILEESHEHLDAETLYDRVRACDESIGLATVYRTLSLLKQVGLVEEHRLGAEHSHFEATPETPHYHFTCRHCGRVIEFAAPEVLNVARELSAREGLHVTDVHLFLSGCCARCQKGETE
ncbi:MAG: transcriptional repressor [Anaerolineae bacterium]|nr:transcriptional repressor [Anaerolineae bacterium]